MRVSEIMTVDFQTVDATSTLSEAAQKMQSFNVGFLPVRDGRQIIGVITDRDIVVRALAQGSDPGSTSARDIMTSEVIYCYEDESVELAAKLMEENRVRRVIACDYDGEPVGIVSIEDLAIKARDGCLAGAVLERVGEAAVPIR